MSAKDNLLHKIRTVYVAQEQGFTAQDCEDFISVKRSVISHYLNRLCDEGKLTKENTRPVRFHLVKGTASVHSQQKTSCFNTFIGAEGSLRAQIELCRAAVNYPSGGLPVLLVGESGVGKSYLANLIQYYAQERKIIAPTRILVELNCADYANNPELLSGTLFGHTKGAFTGADREKTGLLDQANDSFLFLDEVHRLSAENQEKLFMFMDKGYFYRLGDTTTRHSAQVRFLFATTENTDDVLLTTFRRRIPIRIELPPFNVRPITERVALIEAFLRYEAIQLRREIAIDNTLMQQLLSTPVRGNVGELKNQIKVLCAEAWSQQKEDTGDKPLRLSRQRPLPETLPTDCLLITANDQPESVAQLGQRLAQWFDDDKLLLEFCQSANTPLFTRKLEQFLLQNNGQQVLNKSRSGYLWQQSQQAFHALEELTGIELNTTLRKKLWIFLCYALNNPAPEERIAALAASCTWTAQRARMLAVECLQQLHVYTSQSLPILQPLLSVLFHHYVEPDELIQGVIVSHGSATASSIAGTANKLTGGYYLKAFDMPFSVNTRGIIEMLIRHLDSIKNSSGLIILVDMGSLNEIYREIKLHLHSDLLVMNNVTTAMALDIAGKIQHRLSMQEIVDSIKGAYEVEARYYEGMVQGNKIIISCISGSGISKRLKEIVQCYLAGQDIDISTMEYDDLKWKLSRADTALNGTKLIITTTDLDAGIIPLVNVQQLLKEKSSQLWHDYFSDLLSPQQLEPMIDDIVKLFTLEGVASHLNFLNPSVVIEEVDILIKHYESHYKVHFESYLRINLFMHIAAMIERLMVNETLHHRDNHPLTSTQREFIDLQGELLKPLVRKFKLIPSLTEQLMIYELIEPWVTA